MSWPPYLLEIQPKTIVSADYNGGQKTGHCGCYDHREPSYNTVVYGDTLKGFLPAGSYDFTREGTVVSTCTGRPLPEGSLWARTDGPIVGVTMGACVPRAVQSSQLNKAGWFNPIPSSLARKCYA
jgi:hypothetical protein